MRAKPPVKPREVAARRGRAAKEPLSRDAIVAAALDLLTREGLAAMSLRKVAALLDTGPASLYVYVDNLQALQALVLDRALADVALPAKSRRGWRDRLDALLRSYLLALDARPGLAQLAMTTIAMGPNALRILETLLGLLAEAGLPPAAAAWAVDLLTLYVTAIAAEQHNRREQGFTLGPMAKSLRALPPEQFPWIHAAREELLSGVPSSRFSWAIDVLVNGILETPRRKE
jgi:AcrR family transcriptional regulator